MPLDILKLERYLDLFSGTGPFELNLPKKQMYFGMDNDTECFVSLFGSMQYPRDSLKITCFQGYFWTKTKRLQVYKYF